MLAELSKWNTTHATFSHPYSAPSCSPQAQHLHLATRFQLILPPLLSTPEAALAPTVLPLALAGSGAVEGDAQSAAQQSRRIGFTHGLMKVLGALIRWGTLMAFIEPATSFFLSLSKACVALVQGIHVNLTS